MMMHLDHLSPMDRRYAEGASRLGFAHAGHAVSAAAQGDRNLAEYHKRETVMYARFLIEGLTRVAQSLGHD